MAFSYRYPDAQIDNRTDYLEIKVLKYQPPNVQFQNDIDELYNARQANQNPLVSSPSALVSAKETLKKDKFKYGNGITLERGKDQYKNKEESLGYVFLPIPQSVTDRQGVDWKGSNLNPFAAAGIAAGMGVITSDDNIIEAIGKEGSGLAQRLFGEATGDQRRAIQTFFATQAVNAFNANVNVNEVIARTTGQILNQNLELLFNGIQLRQFDFTFSLTPRRRKESETIKNIVRTFKKNMSARREGGVFLQTPNIFQLCYKTGRQKHAYLNSFFPTALTNMSVNYTGSGRYATYEDTSPVSMLLNLQFSEISPIYQKDYDSDDGLIGVGY